MKSMIIILAFILPLVSLTWTTDSDAGRKKDNCDRPRKGLRHRVERLENALLKYQAIIDQQQALIVQLQADQDDLQQQIDDMPGIDIEMQEVYDRIYHMELHGIRFMDLGDGTIYDNHSGLTWLKDAGCLGGDTWLNTRNKIADLASGQCGLTDGSLPGDWKLPTSAQLEDLIGKKLPNANGDNGWKDGDAFINVFMDSFYYWGDRGINGAYFKIRTKDGYASWISSNSQKALGWPVKR